MIAPLLLALAQGTTPARPAQPPATTPAAHPPEGAMHGLLNTFDMICNRVFRTRRASTASEAFRKRASSRRRNCGST